VVILAHFIDPESHPQCNAFLDFFRPNGRVLATHYLLALAFLVVMDPAGLLPKGRKGGKTVKSTQQATALIKPAKMPWWWTSARRKD